MAAAQPTKLSKPLDYGGVVKILFPSLVTLLLIVIGLVALVWLKRSSPSTGPSPVSTGKAVTPSQGQAQIPTVSTTLTADGFNPAQANCSAGKILLTITNQSGAQGLTLLLTRGNQPIAEFGVPPGTNEFRQEITLEAGEYTLKEIDHPAWVFQITAQ